MNNSLFGHDNKIWQPRLLTRILVKLGVFLIFGTVLVPVSTFVGSRDASLGFLALCALIGAGVIVLFRRLMRSNPAAANHLGAGFFHPASAPRDIDALATDLDDETSKSVSGADAIIARAMAAKAVLQNAQAQPTQSVVQGNGPTVFGKRR